jgi:hypothetical protein
MTDSITRLKDLWGHLNQCHEPNRAIDAGIFLEFDPAAKSDPWPKLVEDQIAGRGDFEEIHRFTRSVDRALSIAIADGGDPAHLLREASRSIDESDINNSVLSQTARAILMRHIEQRLVQIQLSGEDA